MAQFSREEDLNQTPRQKLEKLPHWNVKTSPGAAHVQLTPEGEK
jgi:hypothetical protein